MIFLPPSSAPARRVGPLLRMLYFLAVVVADLAAPRSVRPYVVAGLTALQVMLLLASRATPLAILNTVARLRNLFAFLLILYLVLPDRSAPDAASAGLRLNEAGLGRALVVCGQVLTIVLATAVIRRGLTGADLVDALRRLRFPGLLVYSVDNTLALLGGGRPDRGRWLGPEEPSSAPAGPGFREVAGRLVRGDTGPLIEAIRARMARASERTARLMDTAHSGDPRLAHDITVVSGLAAMIVSTRFVTTFVLIPFASGLRALVAVPLGVLAAHLTHGRFGATAVGAVGGLIGLLYGEGRYGVFEVLRPVVPGLAIDLLWPLFRRLPRRVGTYAVLGSLAAVCSLSTEAALLAAVQARREAYLFLVPGVVSELVFGSLSGAVTYALLRALGGLAPDAVPTPSPPRRPVAPPEPSPGTSLPPPGDDRAEPNG